MYTHTRASLGHRQPSPEEGNRLRRGTFQHPPGPCKGLGLENHMVLMICVLRKAMGAGRVGSYHRVAVRYRRGAAQAWGAAGGH